MRFLHSFKTRIMSEWVVPRLTAYSNLCEKALFLVSVCFYCFEREL